MKKFNKGMVITSALAAALAAMTFAGCGSIEDTASPAETVKSVQASAYTAGAETSAKAAEVTAESKLGTAASSASSAVTEDVSPEWAEGDVYAGTYAEEIAGRGTMEITRNSDGTYSVEVGWASSAAEKCLWSFSGEFNGRGVMHYNNACKTIVAFDENGNYACDYTGQMTPYTTYTAGSGYIEFKDEGVLEWHDDMGDVCPGTIFVNCDSRNTKADEVGTAGSDYCADEWQAEGDFYEVSGNRISLKITKSDTFENTYNCMVRMAGSAFDSVVYGFSAHYENDTLVYDSGAKKFISFDSDGNMNENYIIDEGHTGTISYTGAAGLRWTDSDGSSYVFMDDITFA